MGSLCASIHIFRFLNRLMELDEMYKSKSSGLWRRVVLRWDTSGSEDLAASIFNSRRHNPGDLDLNQHRRENIRSRSDEVWFGMSVLKCVTLLHFGICRSNTATHLHLSIFSRTACHMYITQLTDNRTRSFNTAETKARHFHLSFILHNLFPKKSR
jgi:hypothetical protein